MQFTNEESPGAYWRVMTKAAVYECHDTSSTVVGYHYPGEFARRIRSNPQLTAREDPDFMRTAPGDDSHLSRQGGYVVVVQEHVDFDDALWVLTKTAPPGASRGGWMLTQSQDLPRSYAC